MLGSFAVLSQRGPFSRRLLTYDLSTLPGEPSPGEWFLVPFLHDIVPALLVSTEAKSQDMEMVVLPALSRCLGSGVYPDFGTIASPLHEALEREFIGWDDALAIVRFLQDSQRHDRKAARLTVPDPAVFLRNLQQVAARDSAFAEKTAATRRFLLDPRISNPIDLPRALWETGTAARQLLFQEGVLAEDFPGCSGADVPGQGESPSREVLVASFQERAARFHSSLTKAVERHQSISLVVSSEILADLYAALLKDWQMPFVRWPVAGRQKHEKRSAPLVWLSTRQFSSVLLPETGSVFLDMGIPAEWPFFWQRFSMRSLLAIVREIAGLRSMPMTVVMSALTLSALDACQVSSPDVHINASAMPSFSVRSSVTALVGKTTRPRPGILLPPVLHQLRKNYDLGRDALLLLNIRGLATIIECPECGYTATCPVCGDTLTLSADRTRLFCKQCGYVETVPDVCPNCHGVQLRARGCGLDRLAQELRRTFPAASIQMLSSNQPGPGTGALPVLFLGTYADAQRIPALRPGLIVFPDVSVGLQHPVFDNVEQLTAVVHSAIREAGEAPVVIQLDRRTVSLNETLGQRTEAVFLEQEKEQRHELLMPPFSRQFDIRVPWRASMAKPPETVENLRSAFTRERLTVQGLHAELLTTGPHAHTLLVEFRAAVAQPQFERRIANVLSQDRLFQNAAIRIY